jgi:flavin reductase (DIM6/NTAB) family NADH-FMN oxidoreductase RutF
VERDTFDSLMTRMDTAMIVLTASDGDERAGCLVGFHTQSSIEPRRYSIWVSKMNHTYRVARRARSLAVHLLADGDRDVAERFGSLTGDDVDKFAGIEWEPGPDGVPLLARCPNRFVARPVALHDDDGDHACVVIEPVDTWATADFAPLRFDAIQDIEPGHEAE